MNVVDSSAWLAYFTDEPGAGFFRRAIEDADRLVVPTICLYEVFRHILRQRGAEPALQAVAAMQTGRVLELDTDLSLLAAQTGLSENLAMADAIVYASALRVDGLLWTQDAHFEGKPRVRFQAKAKSG